MSRGGKRIGAGVKPGTETRNAAKPDEQKLSIEKTISFTEAEWSHVQKRMKQQRIKTFSKYGRRLVLEDIKKEEDK